MTHDTGTALDLYTRMMNTYIAPSLLAHGLTGSGGKFALPYDSAWALLGFQKWRPVTPTRVAFTVNLSFFDRAEWTQRRVRDTLLPAKPEHNMNYGTWSMVQRIGFLMPQRRDHWWQIALDTEVDHLASEVVGVLVRYGMPWLRAHATASGEEHPC